ncbi:MAG: tRNA (N6-isopentenyl adenosine(37)-C2)-methylthiotransferase MiaB, partial [Rhodospirillales bacterium]|nr:tRNA (N6-isopentenyl adenosine(37)-C2)-methylthiotransferase MiaB [Rhodospirillales bacterium]
LVGRSPYMQAVHTEGSDDLLGTIVNLMVTDGYANSLRAEAILDQSGQTISTQTNSERVCA